MDVLMVDDEILALQDLEYAVKEALPNAGYYCFNKAKEALEFVEDNKVDIAFLDINMRVLNGLEIAVKLKNRWPNINIIFCTGYGEHAVDAFNMHASGYLMKPITAESIKEEIKNLRYDVDKIKPLIFVDTNHFNLYDFNGKQIEFKRKLSKELFKALLLSKDNRTVEELSALLWGKIDDTYIEEKNKNYLMQLFTDIRHTLEEHKIEGILCKDIDGYYLNSTLIKNR